MTNCLIHKPALAGLALAALAVSAPWPATAATPKPQPQQKRVMSVPSVPDLTCALTADSTVKLMCPTFVVQTFVVVDTNNNPAGCLAAMPYNQLTMALGTQAKSAVATWQLPAAVPAIFVGNGTYAGISLSSVSGSTKQPSDLFSPVKGTISADGKTVTMTTLAGAVNGIPLNHLPMVQYTLPNGNKVSCLGIDPIITNSDN